MSVTKDLYKIYPFLEGKTRSSDVLDESLLESVVQKAAESREVQKKYFEQYGTTLVAAARALALVYRNGGRLLAVGNGGSSCDAAHIAVEFIHPIGVGKPSLEAIDLSVDSTSITAISNDFGFEQVFARQLLAKGREGDALIGLSTSGNSKNVLAAFAQAKKTGMVTIALVGGNGGKIATSSDVDYCLVVENTSIHRVQESHLPTYHILWDLVHTILAG
ncbi:SIS domain-containing protein [Anabaena sp. CCY 9402-a]|uniref:D-sedoheptulose-7-phosphate isomerase n=1 Tax=Anabaena sp. CCY 9402-a TaxID=3103867 RepID=UPI0039C66C95